MHTHRAQARAIVAVRRRAGATPAGVAAVLAALAVLLALAACGGGGDADDVATAPDDATAEAMRAVAVQTNAALADEEGAPAPTNALGGGAPAAAAAPYQLSGAESEPEAVRAAERGGLDRPLFVWFVADGCDACAAIEDEVATVRDSWSDRVGFVTIDVDDPAAADVVRRLNVASAPAFVVLYSSGSPAANFTEWPGAASFGQYLEQVLQLDAGTGSGDQD